MVIDGWWAGGIMLSPSRGATVPAAHERRRRDAAGEAPCPVPHAPCPYGRARMESRHILSPSHLFSSHRALLSPACVSLHCMAVGEMVTPVLWSSWTAVNTRWKFYYSTSAYFVGQHQRPDARGCSATSVWIRELSASALFSALAYELFASDSLFMLLGWLVPTSSTIAPPRVCLLPTPTSAACASSMRRGSWLGPAWPHGHQRRRSSLTTWSTPMQHTFEIDKIFGTYVCNMCVKHMQHPDKTIATWKNT
jgi:hypothetical protein